MTYKKGLEELIIILIKGNPVKVCKKRLAEKIRKEINQ